MESSVVPVLRPVAVWGPAGHVKALYLTYTVRPPDRRLVWFGLVVSGLVWLSQVFHSFQSTVLFIWVLESAKEVN